MKKNLIFLVLILLNLGLLLSSCDNPRATTKETEENTNFPLPSIEVKDATFNIFVENSGSMKGFFQGNTTLKQIITEYHDRIEGTLGGKVTFNYINTKIEKVNAAKVEDYLIGTASRCTEKYTRIDSILSMAMNSLNPDEVNLVFSDYCFESPNGDFVTARSGITKIFEQRLRAESSMTVAIMKFDCTFDGFYYPGRIRNKNNLPAYLWAFGPSTLIKKVINLPITHEHNTFVLEPYSEFSPHFVKFAARGISPDNKVIVRYWEKDRHDDIYRLNFDVDLTNSAMNLDCITDINKYQIKFKPETGSVRMSSDQEDYYIDAVVKNETQDVYTFTLCSTHPSPGIVSINMANELPLWVETSNFEGQGIPESGKTLGIKYLIEGVYNAYKNLNNNVYSVMVSLQ